MSVIWYAACPAIQCCCPHCRALLLLLLLLPIPAVLWTSAVLTGGADDVFDNVSSAAAVLE
jgi:hypothetical protein